MTLLTIVLSVIFAFVAFCIVGLILLQEGKGGGLSAMGGAAMDNLVGARNPLRKITSVFAIIFLFLLIAIGTSLNRQNNADESIPEGLPVQPSAVESSTTPVVSPVSPETPAVPGTGEAVTTPDETSKAPSPEGENKTGESPASAK